MPVILRPGDWIGRGTSAALRIADGRISEAHAMVSLRGGSLWLIALRGRLLANGKVHGEVLLDDGVEVGLAEGIVLRCEGVELPEAVFGLRLGSSPPQALVGTTSVFSQPTPMLRSGFFPDAAAVLWTLADEWQIRIGDSAPRPVAPGERFTLGTLSLDAVAVPTLRAQQTQTRPSTRGSLVWSCHREGVDLVELNGTRLSLPGVPGKIMAAALMAPSPLSWTELCQTVWPNDHSSSVSLRNRLDVGIARLRARLRELGASEARLAMDGAGRIVVSLPPQDTVRFVDAGLANDEP